jgi:RNA polymerase-binding transcription factor DksA
VTLIDNAKYIVREIDDALRRIDEKSYGWDDEGACWIREERLEALPWARREIEGQKRLETRLRPENSDPAYGHDDALTSF